ncbi:hypothetical protein [Corynebacterium ulcerans]|uniref:hypothetical protein n=1 Tax=Corynebacterium ulcerans TaxID=65058 RepID=UPI000269D439|nr:hypothetical protein [Corynebacterium ulcerans]AIT89163.1 Hypothetical protein Cul210932_1217 [Corynebacterium ulcerans]ALD94940.1 Hypothetical protein Cul131001_1236 [Corynebacterium ulcerans]ESU57551.1 hypothetical protein D881_07060 [Corynebacterium ulcerans NCTC 12077]SQG58791.1 Uncharacterised protein [Corynebacterium ulcerans]BAM27484.1 hypothetical protein CULC0102_1285 [Corynebacterium ulcerans 0102]
MKIKLVAWARRWDGEDWEHFVENDVVEDDSPWAERLVRIGAAVVIDGDGEPVQETDAEPAEAVSDAVVSGEPSEKVSSERPKHTATTDSWRAYANSFGIDTKGMKKQEIIAAVNAVE